MKQRALAKKKLEKSAAAKPTKPPIDEPEKEEEIKPRPSIYVHAMKAEAVIDTTKGRMKMRTFVWILKRDRILSIFMGATLLRNAQMG